MRVAAIVALLISFVTRAHAHDPGSAAFELVERDTGWGLSVHLSTAAADHTLRSTRSDFAEFDRHRYEEALVAYLRQHIRLEYEGVAVPLGRGAVRVGAHQSDLFFALPELPPGARSLELAIDAFAGAHKTNVVRIRPRGAAHVRYMLDEGVEYRAAWPRDPGVTLTGAREGEAAATPHDHHGHAPPQRASGHRDGHETSRPAALPVALALVPLFGAVLLARHR